MNKIQQLHDQIVNSTELIALYTHRGNIAETAKSTQYWWLKAADLEATISDLELEFFNLSKSL
jgi:hypothetical protein|tara:strand:- start:493 stop:681 length:189 start_codon:yes stop_codon:yes gene_type:complete